MRSHARLVTTLVFAGLMLGTLPALAYPDRPVNLIVPWGVGGGGDRVARVIAQLLSSKLGASVPVINVAGASGQVGLNKTLNEPPDGYNIVEITSDTYMLFAADSPKFKVSEFLPIAVIDQQPSGFFVRMDSPWQTWDDVAEAAKSRNVLVAGSGFGTQSDATVNYFNRTQKLKFVSVPFGKPGPRWDSVLGGHTDLVYAQFGDLGPYLANKKLRPVLTFADNRIPAFPKVPTAKELKYNIDIAHFRAFAVKHGTEGVIYKKLTSAMDAVSGTPEYRKMLADEAAAPDSYVSGEAARPYIERWVKFVHGLIGRSAASSAATRAPAK